MPKKGELSKTARASLANREDRNHVTDHICASCDEPIWLADLFMIQERCNGKKHMAAYHKDHYKVQ